MATGKLNSAYSIGGPNLLIKILKPEVFPGLQVNHIIDVNFGGFEDLINAIGCVYTDVDHRYYNNTVLDRLLEHRHPAGYQKMCGTDAPGVRALPAHRLGHRPQRAPAGLPALGQGPVRCWT